jgi:hypothetical protein
MSKILKRPMFRGGGAVNAQGMGIMSGLEPRINYAQAGQVLPYSETLEKQKRIQDILKTDFKTAEDFGKEYDTYVESLDPTMLFGIDEFGPGSYGESLVEKQRIASSPEVKQSFIAEKLAEQQKVIDEARALGIGTEQIPDIDKKEPDKREAKILEGRGADTKTTDTMTRELPKSDLKAVYEDLLPLFEKELGPEEDEFRRQKYMQLAKFGLGLLAQPGGSLAEAVGKAGAEPLAGLEAAAAREAQARRAPKALALEAALKEVDPGALAKQVRDIKKLYPDMKDSEIKKFIFERGTGTIERTIEDRINTYAEDLYDDTIVGSKTAGRKAAEAIEKSGLGIGSFEKLPDSQDQLVEGQYYIKKDGSLRRFDGEKLLTPSDKGFK